MTPPPVPAPPALVSVNDFPGEDFVAKWPAFVDGIYAIFRRDISDASLTFQGLPVVARYHPAYEGKHGSFWHLMSEGSGNREEHDRTPDLERCERIAWVAWAIRNADNINLVRWWENERATPRGLKLRVPLWVYAHDYAVILEKHPSHYFLITTYCLQPHRKLSFTREWQEWERQKSRGRPEAASDAPSTHGG